MSGRNGAIPGVRWPAPEPADPERSQIVEPTPERCAMTCDFPCDPDCDASCHQLHLPSWKRLPDMCRCAGPIVLAKVVQTCWACPSQWDAWDAEGRYYYLRYRFGRGTVDAYSDPDDETWTTIPDGRVASFETDDPYDGVISLDDFLTAAGLQLAVDAERS